MSNTYDIVKTEDLTKKQMRQAAEYCNGKPKKVIHSTACKNVSFVLNKEKWIPMPSELTAENGAKALLIGEFHESIPVQCPDCDGAFEDIRDDEICETCGGAGDIPQDVPVSWTTIKEIYAMAVKHLQKEEEGVK